MGPQEPSAHDGDLAWAVAWPPYCRAEATFGAPLSKLLSVPADSQDDPRPRCAPPYAFSFQTQSLFDASVPGIPHFVYTDHTALAATYDADSAKDDGPSERWLVREREIRHAT
jgi:hypothetical protein